MRAVKYLLPGKVPNMSDRFIIDFPAIQVNPLCRITLLFRFGYSALERFQQRALPRIAISDQEELKALVGVALGGLCGGG